MESPDTIYIPVEWYDTLERSKVLLDTLIEYGVEAWQPYVFAKRDADKILSERKPLVDQDMGDS